MSISSKIHDTIEDWIVEWRDRLRGWMVSWAFGGLESFTTSLEPDVIDSMRETLEWIAAEPDLPPGMSAAILKTLGKGNILEVAHGWLITGLFFIPALLASTQAQANLIGYKHESLLHSYRLDPISVINAWRRDPAAYEKYFADLKDQGWSDGRIDALKFFTEFIPTADEQTLWLAREVFEPIMVDRYGLDDELPNYLETDFSKVGVNPDQMKNKWRAHWEHASFMQVIEMLHRGLLSLDKVMPPEPATPAGWDARDVEGEAALYDWYRLVEIPPFWRDRLTAMSWNVPTRVDVRRWWDLRTIDEAELRNVYHRQGYHGKDLDNYVLWTKVYVAFPDLLSRWTNGWITEAEVRSEIVALGMPEARVNELMQTKIKSAQPARVASERDLTKTDIYKGIKADRITRSEGIELLMDLGFDEDEADILLATNIPEDDTDVVVAQRELSKTDLRAGLAAEELTEAEVVDRLQRLRYTLADSQLLLRIFKATITPPAEEKDRQVSKADITLGVTKGLLSPEDAYIKLQEIGFSPADSQYILLVKAEVSPFSPINYAEFKDLTQKYKAAAGMEAKPMSEELKAAAAAVVRLSDEVKSLEESIAEEKRGLVDDEVIPEPAARRLKRLQVSRNRAEAELARVKSEYDRLVAEWRHGLP